MRFEQLHYVTCVFVGDIIPLIGLDQTPFCHLLNKYGKVFKYFSYGLIAYETIDLSVFYSNEKKNSFGLKVKQAKISNQFNY